MDNDGIPSFPITVFRIGASYFASVQGARGCMGCGASEVEAVENARGSIRIFLVVEKLLQGREGGAHLQIRP